MIKKQKLRDIFGADYAIRMGYYAINYANCTIFSSAILSIFYYNPGQKGWDSKLVHPSPTFNVDTRAIFYLFVGKNAIFSNIDEGGWGIRDPTQVSQLLLARIVGFRGRKPLGGCSKDKLNIKGQKLNIYG